MPSSKVPIKIVHTDLVNDCNRLNRRFDLVEGQASTAAASVAALQEQVTKLTATSATTQGTASVSPVPLVAPATSNLTLTASFQDVPGMTVKLTKTGWWKLDVTVECLLASTDGTTSVIMLAGTTALPGVIHCQSSATASNFVLTANRPWLFNSISGIEQIKVQAKKASGSGGSTVTGSATPAQQVSQIVAVWVGPASTT